MKKDTLRQWLVLIAVVGTIIFNILANALPLNGLDTGEISDRFDIIFVPAGYVFSIWGLIYLGLLAYGIYQALPSQRENPRLRGIDYLFLLSSVANITWLFLWHYEVFEFTLIAMLALLGSLIGIYLRLRVGRVKVSNGERWAVQIPFSIYLGWISVATIANASQLLYYLGWDGWGIAPEIWAVIMLGAGVVLSVLMTLTRSDIAYSLVLVWAYIGIAQQHPDKSLVVSSVFIATGIILLVLIADIIRKFRSPVGMQPAV